jgi:hypothetical protein
LSTFKVLVIEFEAEIRDPENPHGVPRVRRRWRAEFTAGPPALRGLAGVATSANLAVGALVREAALTCDTADQVVDLVAGLFSDPSHRPADESLGRAVRLANDNPRRRHPGCFVTVVAMPSAGPPATPAAVPARKQLARKGGAS